LYTIGSITATKEEEEEFLERNEWLFSDGRYDPVDN
jgi:hypothetical protein